MISVHESLILSPSLEVWVLVLALTIGEFLSLPSLTMGIAIVIVSLPCPTKPCLSRSLSTQSPRLLALPQGLYTCCSQCQEHLTISFSLIAILQIPTETSLA